ncbi:MAG: enoyl-CoA hydratase/isomerase family protein, partial [Saprospiraceae bacterium]
MNNEYLQYEIDSEGIATITINQVNEPANLFSLNFIKTYIETALTAIADDTVIGVVVTSARKIFMAGADLRSITRTIDDKEAFLNDMLEMHKNFRIIETSGKPFVAAINGTALGGGL